MKRIQEIAKSSFWQLAVIYSLLILVIALGFLGKYTIHFEIFAIILALLGISLLFFNKESKEKDSKVNRNLHIGLFILALLIIVSFRTIPYINNSIPIGYDTGLYKYAIEHGLQNKDNWVIMGMEPGFLYLMKALSFIPSSFLLTYGFIFFCLLLGIAIYFFTRKYFGENEALIALLLYAASTVQYQVFTYMYYRNIIGLSLMLFAFFFLKPSYNFLKSDYKYSRWLFIILSGILAGIHRPTFYILGLSYFAYAFISPIQNKKYNLKILVKNILSGIMILIIASLFYLGTFKPALNILSPVISSFTEPGNSPGTFISFFQYQFSTLAYLPLAILGFFFLIKRKQFNILFFWTLINAAIVYFQFFFFNRFIIHLDIALIILASLGASLLIKEKKKLGIALLIVLLASSFIMTFQLALNTKPLISQPELQAIESLQGQGFAMSISSQYSPWLQGYSNMKVIAPGMFDYDKWNKEQWNTFWASTNQTEIKQLMSQYQKPIYLFAGNRNFEKPCFTKLNEYIYNYTC